MVSRNGPAPTNARGVKKMKSIRHIIILIAMTVLLSGCAANANIQKSSVQEAESYYRGPNVQKIFTEEDTCEQKMKCDYDIV